MDEFHAIVVGRPNHSPTRIYLLGPGPKGRCIVRAEDEYRRENWLKMNIALASRCVFSGSEGDGRAFLVMLEGELKIQNA
jgi:hypothetical protein